MSILFQPHIHTDHIENQWLGMNPKEVAHAVVASPLDAIAITPQIHITPDFLDVRSEINGLLARKDEGRRIETFLGVEAQMRHEGHSYHVGCVFPDTYDRTHLPDPPPRRMSLQQLEQYRAAYSPLIILNHPTRLSRNDSHQYAVAKELAASGAFDGIEAVNANDLLDKHKNVDVSTALKIFLEARERIGTLALIGGGDANSPKLVTSAVTEIDADSVHQLFEAIRAGKTRALVDASILGLEVAKLRKEVQGIGDFVKTAAINQDHLVD